MARRLFLHRQTWLTCLPGTRCPPCLPFCSGSSCNVGAHVQCSLSSFYKTESFAFPTKDCLQNCFQMDNNSGTIHLVTSSLEICTEPSITCKLLQDQALFYVKYVSQDIWGTARSFKGYFQRYIFFIDGHSRDIKVRYGR